MLVENQELESERFNAQTLQVGTQFLFCENGTYSTAPGQATEWISAEKEVKQYDLTEDVDQALKERCATHKRMLIPTLFFAGRLEEECTLLDQRRWMRNNFIGMFSSNTFCGGRI